jgi:hypothetical protein
METPALSWTLQNEIAIPADVTPLLVEGETAVAAFKTFRDSAVFTTKRLIVRDAQGLTGKKVEIYSLPYSSINMWSSENAGTLDWNSEIELWTRAGHIKVKLAKGADVRRLDSLIAWAVLTSHRPWAEPPQVSSLMGGGSPPAVIPSRALQPIAARIVGSPCSPHIRAGNASTRGCGSHHGAGIPPASIASSTVLENAWAASRPVAA